MQNSKPSEEVANRLHKWIRKRLFSSCAFCIVTRLFQTTIGILTLVFVSWCAAFVALMILMRIDAIGSLAGENVHTMRPSLVLLMVTAIVALSFWTAWRHPYGLGTFRKPVHLRDRVSEYMLAAMGSIIGEVLISGPRLIRSGGESFWECRHLMRARIGEIAAVLAWMVRRNRKVSVSEMAAAFAGLNLFRLIPQLRLLDGFIYLPSTNGVCLLSTEMKAALIDLLNIDQFAFDDSATSERPEKPYASEEERWYSVLGLDVYASIVEVKKMYRILARKYHPDRHRNEDVATQIAAEERMKEINEAYRNICRSFAA